MAYRLNPHKRIAKGCARAAREQLQLALNALGGSEVAPTGVHECRKAIKRLRALVRLCAPALGAKAASAHNRRLRDVAHHLAGHREQAVLIETFEKLCAASDAAAAPADTLAPVRAFISARRAELLAPVEAEHVAEARALLARASVRLSADAFASCNEAAILAGLGACYRQGRKAYRAALARPSNEAMHDLRKAVQTHWRHMHLFHDVWPEQFMARVGLARALSQMLGDDHDIATLMQRLRSEPALPRAAVRTMAELSAARQVQLRADIRLPAGLLFAETGKAFEARMTAYFALAKAAPAHQKLSKNGGSPTAD